MLSYLLAMQAIIVSPIGWANAATIDVAYGILHMMGYDDILVGLGDVFVMNQSDPISSAVGDCKYIKAIPHGKFGFGFSLGFILISGPKMNKLTQTNPDYSVGYTASCWVLYILNGLQFLWLGSVARHKKSP